MEVIQIVHPLEKIVRKSVMIMLLLYLKGESLKTDRVIRGWTYLIRMVGRYEECADKFL